MNIETSISILVHFHDKHTHAYDLLMRIKQEMLC
jgi:hypothetical protein